MTKTNSPLEAQASSNSANRTEWLRNLLLPLVRFALDRGLKHQDLIEAAKLAFIDVARERVSAEQATVSKLSILTGLQRYDVKSLLQRELVTAETSRQSLVARVLSRWANDKRFLNERGRPRVLTCDGKESEFAALVNQVSQAINPYTVLFELERLKLVQRTSKGLKLESAIMIDSKDVQGGLKLLAHDSNDLYRAVTDNIFQNQDLPQLHIRTEYDNIPLSVLPQIRLWILKAGTQFHAKVQKYLSTFDRDTCTETSLKNDNSTARVAVTTFGVGIELNSNGLGNNTN